MKSKITLILFILLFTTKSQGQQIIHLMYSHEDTYGYLNKSNIYINGNEAAYHLEENRKNGQYTGKQKFPNDLLKNQPANSILKTTEPYTVFTDAIGKIFYVNGDKKYLRFPSESLKEVIYQQENEVEWKITKESKKIGNYLCTKATGKKNGRNFTVWFSKDLPYSFGPVLLNGLPGLIIEASDDWGLFTTKLLAIQKVDQSPEFQRIKNYFASNKVLSYAAYEKFIKKILLSTKASMAGRLPDIKKEYKIEKNGGSLQINIDPRFFYETILDIPEHMDEELNKISF